MYRAVMVVVAFCLLFAHPLGVLGEEAGSGQLIDRAKEYDGREIAYSGEVIGDILNAGDHVWLNVSDGGNAIGVWVPSGPAGEVRLAGRYSQIGDTIRVAGIFHRACPEHGGDMDLHADSITLLTRGGPVAHQAPAWKVWTAASLAVAAAVLMAVVLAGIRRGPASRCGFIFSPVGSGGPAAVHARRPVMPGEAPVFRGTPRPSGRSWRAAARGPHAR